MGWLGSGGSGMSLAEGGGCLGGHLLVGGQGGLQE